MPNFQIIYDVDFSALGDLAKFIQDKLNRTPNLQEAVRTAGDHTTQAWLNKAGTKFKHSQGGYARGIVSGVTYPFEGDPLHYRIINRAPHAKALEDGFESFDMKKALQSSDKIRISKDGKKYLIIPFRHGIPGTKGLRAMPKDIFEKAPIAVREIINGKVVYNIDSSRTGAKNLRHSAVISTHREGSIRGFGTIEDADLLRRSNARKVVRNIYKWGDRLKDVDFPKLKEHHKFNIYEGMVRFQTNPNINRQQFNMGKFVFNPYGQTENMRSSSAYMTFRIMHEDSEGWIHPGLKAMNIAGETKKEVEPVIIKMLAQAARQDLQEVLNNLGD